MVKRLTSVTVAVNKIFFSEFNGHEVIESHFHDWKTHEQSKYFKFIQWCHDKGHDDAKIKKKIAQNWFMLANYRANVGKKVHRVIQDHLEHGHDYHEEDHGTIEFDFNLILQDPEKVFNFCKWDQVPVMGEFNQFKEALTFIHEQGYVFHKSEFYVKSEKLGLKGIIDAIFKKGDEFLIIDWKRCLDLSLKCEISKFCEKEPFKGKVRNDKHGKFTVQLNLYSRILEKEYDMKVAGLAIVQVHGTLENFRYHEIEKIL